jgi:glycogen debranching enzyme
VSKASRFGGADRLLCRTEGAEALTDRTPDAQKMNRTGAVRVAGDRSLSPLLMCKRAHNCVGEVHKSRYSLKMADWLRTVVKIETRNEEFYRLFHQALEDMAALRLPIKGTDHMVFLPAAGLPWFVAPFGRDSLIVSLQNVLIYPEFARGALEILGSLQAKDDDPYRDAEPGKILHELRYGELGHFKLVPHTPYYGTADATPLYLITLHAAWRATGDKELLERHLPTLNRELRSVRSAAV